MRAMFPAYRKQIRNKALLTTREVRLILRLSYGARYPPTRPLATGPRVCCQGFLFPPKKFLVFLAHFVVPVNFCMAL